MRVWLARQWMARVAGRYCPCEWPIKFQWLMFYCGRIDDYAMRADKLEGLAKAAEFAQWCVRSRSYTSSTAVNLQPDWAFRVRQRYHGSGPQAGASHIPERGEGIIRWLLTSLVVAIHVAPPSSLGAARLGAGSVVPHRAPSAWVHGSFAKCVRWRESHDGADPNARGNLYGVKDSSGGYSWAQHVPRAQQDLIAYRLWLKWGVQPWRPYDGC